MNSHYEKKIINEKYKISTIFIKKTIISTNFCINFYKFLLKYNNFYKFLHKSLQFLLKYNNFYIFL